MQNINHSLMIKYGLANTPNDFEVERWHELVIKFINEGLSAEEAGGRAAQQTFTSFNSSVYESASDTIAVLLSKLGNK
ncbi:hypothetical protein [Maridesulfovibrio sp.]|uniref:hypothetical protein n=1 Tax=Maridesulfovibrio sp. TaxID=2795000 RepID=UPI002AA74DD8|nr:hypothetical protein [Maridesulfovibrio sp.]